MNANEFHNEQKLTRSELRQTYKRPDPFTPEELRECYIEKRMSQREIAAHFHCEVRRVSVAMHREGITRQKKKEATQKLYPKQPKPQKNKNVDKKPKYPFTNEELYSLYIEQDMPLREIADKTGVTPIVVSRYLRHFGIQARPHNARPRPDYSGVLREYYKSYERGAKSRGYTFQLTIEEFETLVIQPCFFCGIQPLQKRWDYFFNGIDRRNNELGYIKGNVAPCCGICNKAKSTRKEEDFIEWIIRASEHIKSNVLALTQNSGTMNVYEADRQARF